MTDERKQFERAIDGFEERFGTLKLLSGDEMAIEDFTGRFPYGRARRRKEETARHGGTKCL